MNGYQITFYTQQDRMHGRQPLAQWLIEEIRRLGLPGATLSGAIEGLGRDGVLHAINLFDLSNQPVQVTVVLSEDEAGHLLQHLRQEEVDIFYVRTAVDFGMTMD